MHDSAGPPRTDPASIRAAYDGRRAVVTGGAGFIGSHLVDALVDAGASVVVVDDESNGRLSQLDHVRDRIEVHRASILDADVIRAATDGADVVFHQAAIASVPRSVSEPVRYLDVNATGTMRVLEAARDGGVGTFVYAGSSSYYGDQPGFPRVESMPPDIHSPYAAAKGAGEFMVRAFARCSEIDAMTVRYFNIFGPRQRPDSPYAAVIPRFIVAMLRGEPIRVFGDGMQTRDFTYVANAVHANLLAGMGDRVLRGEVVNVAAGGRRTILDLIEALAAATGVTPRIEHAPERAGEVMHSGADIGAARDLLGYEPIATFEEGLAATVAWCRTWLASQESAESAESPGASGASGAEPAS